jgi:hypothetical protein
VVFPLPAGLVATRKNGEQLVRDSDAWLQARQGEVQDKMLDELIRCLVGGPGSPPKPADGVAEALRRLAKAGRRSNRWRNWAERHQTLARELIAYNRGDCRAVARLTNRVVSNYRVSELEVADE